MVLVILVGASIHYEYTVTEEYIGEPVLTTLSRCLAIRRLQTPRISGCPYVCTLTQDGKTKTIRVCTSIEKFALRCILRMHRGWRSLPSLRHVWSKRNLKHARPSPCNDDSSYKYTGVRLQIVYNVEELHVIELGSCITQHSLVLTTLGVWHRLWKNRNVERITEKSSVSFH